MTVTKPLCCKAQKEITDRCLECDFHLECFPLEDD